jgi:hypothetical protein
LTPPPTSTRTRAGEDTTRKDQLQEPEVDRPRSFRNDFCDPTPEQQHAWQQFNDALGALAAAHSVDPDNLNELAGTDTEEAIRQLWEDVA